MNTNNEKTFRDYGFSFMQLKSILFKQKRYLTDYQVYLLSGILLSVWPLTLNSNFFYNWLMIVYSLLVGFYLNLLIQEKRTKKLFSYFIKRLD